MYKALFTDLDGTLFDDEKNISSNNLEAINRIRDEGKIFSLCSGRQIDFVKGVNEKLGKHRYFIASNGGIIYDHKNEEILFSSNMREERCKHLITYADKHDFLMLIDTTYGRYINDIDKAISTEIEFNEDVSDFVEKNDIVQISLCTEKLEDLNEIVSYIEDEAYDLAITSRFHAECKGKKYWTINVLNKSASKGNAISGLCKYLRINMDDVVAVGDDLNDSSMINMAGIGVAMDNAVPQVKDEADFITNNNNESGIAAVIDEFF